MDRRISPRAADSPSGCHDNQHKLVSQTVAAVGAVQQQWRNDPYHYVIVVMHGCVRACVRAETTLRNCMQQTPNCDFLLVTPRARKWTAGGAQPSKSDYLYNPVVILKTKVHRLKGAQRPVRIIR
jgi:hypothetical protein